MARPSFRWRPAGAREFRRRTPGRRTPGRPGRTIAVRAGCWNRWPAMADFKAKVAFITGGASGVGRSRAQPLAPPTPTPTSTPTSRHQHRGGDTSRTIYCAGMDPRGARGGTLWRQSAEPKLYAIPDRESPCCAAAGFDACWRHCRRQTCDLGAAAELALENGATAHIRGAAQGTLRASMRLALDLLISRREFSYTEVPCE